MSPARALVVSLHDVSPRTRAACELILRELAAGGVERVSLLVIPDHHGLAPVAGDGEFGAWLAGLEREGHEIVTHGYHHRRARRPGERPMQKLLTRFYTADEGEFYDVDRATARALVARGNAELRGLGLGPRGFIAPAWLLGAEAEAALGELGVDYTTTLGSVRDLATGRRWRSQSLVWSVRSGWRRAVSRGWNAALFRRLGTNPLLRISIHPVDHAHPAIWAQIRALLTAALRDRQAMTYLAWIEQQRLSQLSTLNAQPH
jgi:predicted deacetylase